MSRHDHRISITSPVELRNRATIVFRLSSDADFFVAEQASHPTFIAELRIAVPAQFNSSLKRADELPDLLIFAERCLIDPEDQFFGARRELALFDFTMAVEREDVVGAASLAREDISFYENRVMRRHGRERYISSASRSMRVKQRQSHQAGDENRDST